MSAFVAISLGDLEFSASLRAPFFALVTPFEMQYVKLSCNYIFGFWNFLGSL
jgi:hypothetical protein